ncbi:hypothetical protein D3C87_559380 [compost metagenome]
MPEIKYDGIHMAGNSSESWSSKPVILGDTPPIVSERALAAVSLPAYSVVGKDVDGKLVLATMGGADPIAPVGITTNAVDTTVPGAQGWVPYWAAGKFNYDALNFDASFATEADKKAAFEGTGVQIFLDKPRYD